ncbi:hypothetical protein [Dactylosporangium sp. CA-139066]|uniref:hypothetical protein n=1 Tax=Dactylosporangium sp. CA-139066 TaxID=3239930 RepID=UPI003D91608C
MLRALTAVAACTAAVAALWIAYRLERLMTAQNDKLTALRNDLTAVFADVDAKLDQLNAQTDDFNPEAQATFDALKQLVADKQAEIGDVDGSDSAPAEPEQPAV